MKIRFLSYGYNSNRTAINKRCERVWFIPDGMTDNQIETLISAEGAVQGWRAVWVTKGVSFEVIREHEKEWLQPRPIVQAPRDEPCLSDTTVPG